MEKRLLTLQELGEIVGLSTNTLRTMLGGYRFTKYGVKARVNNSVSVVYTFNKEFIKELLNYFDLTRKYKPYTNLKNYIEKFNSPQ